MRFSERLLPMIRHVAEQVDGGSASHAANCKFFASEMIMRGQRDGLSKFLEEALKDVGMFDFALTNMIFDETELEINLKSFGLGPWSILASHAQMTFCVNDQTHDFDFIRAPAALPNKQATTMWPALCAGEGGLWPGLSAVEARVRAVLVTCDAASCVSNTERGMSSSESLSCWACWPEVFLWPRQYVPAALWKGWLVTFETFWQRIFRSLTGFLQVLLKSGLLGKRVPKLSLSLCCKGVTATKPAAPAKDFWISSQALEQGRLLGRARASDFGELTDAGAVVACVCF